MLPKFGNKKPGVKESLAAQQLFEYAVNKARKLLGMTEFQDYAKCAIEYEQKAIDEILTCSILDPMTRLLFIEQRIQSIKVLRKLHLEVREVAKTPIPSDKPQAEEAQKPEDSNAG